MSRTHPPALRRRGVGAAYTRLYIRAPLKIAGAVHHIERRSINTRCRASRGRASERPAGRRGTAESMLRAAATPNPGRPRGAARTPARTRDRREGGGGSGMRPIDGRLEIAPREESDRRGERNSIDTPAKSAGAAPKGGQSKFRGSRPRKGERPAIDRQWAVAGTRLSSAEGRIEGAGWERGEAERG